MERKLAIITGADGGMGMEITRAVAREGYAVIMACCSLSKAEPKCRELAKEDRSCITGFSENFCKPGITAEHFHSFADE